MDKRTKLLISIIKAAGDIAANGFKSSEMVVKTKDGNVKDIITDTDIRVQEFIIKEIHSSFPDDRIIAEEGQKDFIHTDGYSWIIDPIDGTLNFSRGIPIFGISIGIAKGKDAIAGAVYNPIIDELFFAVKGNGAFLNGRRIFVSQTKDISLSTLATGFACLRSNIKQNNLPIFTEVLHHISSIRRLGAASIDLCYVACGRFDGFWEINLNIWDVFAGAIIVKEAGGEVSDFEGMDNFIENRQIIASNNLLHREMINLIGGAYKKAYYH